MGRKIKEELPQNKTDGSAGYQAVVNEYDKSGNLVETKEQIEYTYDNQNRLTERTAKEKKTGKETVHTYRYNAYGDVAVQDDTQFVYGDVSGQVTKETTKLTKNKDVVKNYSYDSAGNKSAFAVKVGDDTKLSLQYTYDGESKLTSVTDEKGNKIVGYDYDTDGNLAERTVDGSGMTTTYAYDYQNHLISLKNQTDSAGVISEYTSKYLTNGQKSKETADIVDEAGKKSKKTATYAYDLLGRITKETKTGSQDISYTYDSNNNRKEMNAGNKVTAYKYNKNDELLRTDTLNTDTEEDSVVIYKNDKNGNQLATVNRYEIPSDKKDSTYVDIDVTLGDNRLNENVVNHYNALNQLTHTLTKNYKFSFTYDAEGLRTSKTVNGEKTVFVWDGDQLVMELSESGKVLKRYIRGNDLVYADKGTDTEKQYYVTDPHGNVVQLTDESGAVTKTYEYDSFGNEVDSDSKDENPFRYCGEYYDKETEEIYLRARYYQPEVGRFLTRDSYTGEEDEPLSLHLYTYCGNDSVNRIDPSGNVNIVVSGGIYKKDKKNGYCYEFIEPALKMINDLYTCNKKFTNSIFSGEIKWLIADNGWTKQNKDDFKKEVQRIGDIKIQYFKSRKKFIKIINQTSVNDPIKTFTVFSHGFPGKISFGYDYSTNQKKLDFRLKDISKLKRSAFKNTGSIFYSCRTAKGASEKNFARRWQNLTTGTVTAYEGRTNYKYINSEYSDASYYMHRAWNKIRGKKDKKRRFPQKSLNMPTGKGKRVYKQMVIRAK